MNMPQNKQRLVELYHLRLKQAEARVVEQQQEIAKTLNELQERQAIVANLEQKIQNSRQFLENDSSTVTAEILQAANRHRYWIDYDKQRESFYLQLTVEELLEKQNELKLRQHNLAKVKAKQDTFKKLVKDDHSKNQRQQHRKDEAEFEDLNAARRNRRVYQ